MTSKRAFLKQLNTTALSSALVAAALLVSAGTAGAEITAVQDNFTTSTNEGANNQTFLEVYDPNRGLTFVQDLGTTWSTIDGLKANSNPGLSYNLAVLGGANWATFTNGITNPNAVLYAVVAEDMGANISITGNQPFDQTNRTYAQNDTVTFLSIFAGLHAQAADLTVPSQPGDASYLISNINDIYTASYNPDPTLITPYTTAIGVWGGWSNPSALSGNTGTVPFNPGGIYGSVVGFQWGHDTATVANGGNGVNQFGTYAATWLLAGNTLTFGSVTPVPIPTAAYLFGSGLIGLVGLARRKMSQRA